MAFRYHFKLKILWTLLKETVHAWNDDKAEYMAAALSYYTVFALAPLLIVAIAVAGFVFGREAAQGHLISEIRDIVGAEGAVLIQQVLANSSKPAQGIGATVVGLATLLFGTTRVFVQLQDALNTIWDVVPSEGILRSFLRKRLLSFSLVLGIGFLFLVSLVVSALVAVIDQNLAVLMPGFPTIVYVIDLSNSFIVISLLFAMIYKFLPDAHVAWGDVWLGAILSALLFSVGKNIMGLYIIKAGGQSVYGAAGSLVVVLVWVYYSAQLLFFGAEFTWVYARYFGSRRESTTEVS
ncbi:YihY/virulence factor BrkB family protein [Candidatus Contendibacter odensensis]|uniref:Ribonuclease BN n=1 Tax=Candidatus Contendobacter odensis Run_B_J11 TaxID=1400861 RepID=A0A7U7J292_9GAMM|nr:YihY/virulence factor BrkB family protein [Candidatus Contendobacter odensis]CDH44820.1 Ribonuclease BN [Candidatus Contendobacter odensis Run_B_J11]